jgi:pteridine reductase
MKSAPHPVALITGAAKRVGATIARRLHAAGFNVALHYRSSAAEMTALVEELEGLRPRSTLPLQADLADMADLALLVPATVAQFGRLDALVNNASSFYPTPMGEIETGHFDDLMATNARAPLFLAQAAAPHLRLTRGSIVNLVDIYADRPIPRYLPYCMAKAALVALTYGLARELGPEVRVNAVAPGNILWSTNPEKAETLAVVEQRTALKRQGSPDDLAGAVLFLIRDAGYVTGQVLRVDGGRWLNI